MRGGDGGSLVIDWSQEEKAFSDFSRIQQNFCYKIFARILLVLFWQIFPNPLRKFF
jgi:hypothetical protein